MTTIWGQASGRMVSSQKTGKMEPPPPPTLPFSSLVILSFFLKKCMYLFFYFWPCWVFVAACRLSLIAAIRGCSLAVACQLLIVVASFVAKHRLSGMWALVDAGSVVVAHRLSCSMAPGIFLDQGSNRFPCIAKRILDRWTTREVGYASLTLGFLAAHFEAWSFPFSSLPTPP